MKFVAQTVNLTALLLLGACSTAALECGKKPPEFRSIGTIQGTRHSSPVLSETLVTEGIVTLKAGTKSFVIQSPDADHDKDRLTSEAILIYHKNEAIQKTLAVGDSVRVKGTVTEFGFDGSLDTTQIVIASNSAAENVAVCAKGVPLPSAVVIGRDAKPPTAKMYQGSLDLTSCGPDCPELDPATNGMDFWESLESMRVLIKDPLVVAGTNKYGDFIVVPNKGVDSANSLNARRGVTANPETADWNPERIKVKAPKGTPTFNLGDELSSLEGVMGYNFGQYSLQLTKDPERLVAAAESVVLEGLTKLTESADDLTIASYNIENFPGDLKSSQNDPAARSAALARHIVTNMKSPAIVALQELQDDSGDSGRAGQEDGIVDGTRSAKRIMDAITALGGPAYMFTEIAPMDGSDGGIPGGNIRVAYIYDPKRVVLGTASKARKGSASESVSVRSFDGQTQLSVNPGRISPESFQRSRKPLAAHFVQLNTGANYFVVNAHLSSKGRSTQLFGPIQPIKNGGEESRIRQATAINQFVQNVLCANPAANIIVLGDLNEFDAFPALQVLQQGGVLKDLLKKLPQVERYTYIFQGNAQALDHIYVSKALQDKSQVDVMHVNSGVEASLQTSDHDPIYAVLRPSGTSGFRAGTPPGSGGDGKGIIDMLSDMYTFIMGQLGMGVEAQPESATDTPQTETAFSETRCSKCGADQYCEDCSCVAGQILELPPKPAPGKPPVMPTPLPDPESPPMTPPRRTPASAGAVWLNEIHYDNVGTDEGEFVEVAGLAESNVAGWKVLLYNGRNGKVYDTADVPALEDSDAGVEGSLGFAAINTFKSGIQNGVKDGVALVDSNLKVVDFVSYEGKLTASDGPASGMTAVELSVQQSGQTPVGRSIGLQGQGSTKGDFKWANMRASPGTQNEAQIFKEGECSASGTC